MHPLPPNLHFDIQNFVIHKYFKIFVLNISVAKYSRYVILDICVVNEH